MTNPSANGFWLGVRILLLGVVIACGCVYVLGCFEFGAGYDALIEAGFDNISASTILANGTAVQSRFREFPWLNAASLASTIGVGALGVCLSFRPGEVLRLPGRFVSQAMVLVGYACLVNDAMINADIVSLDHNAVGILRFDEDSWNPLFLLVLATPPVLAIVVWGFWSRAEDLRWRWRALRGINPVLLLMGLTVCACAVLFTPSNTFYGPIGRHSAMGLGSGLLCVYGVAGVVVGRAFRVEERRESARSFCDR